MTCTCIHHTVTTQINIQNIFIIPNSLVYFPRYHEATTTDFYHHKLTNLLLNFIHMEIYGMCVFDFFST